MTEFVGALSNSSQLVFSVTTTARLSSVVNTASGQEDASAGTQGRLRLIILHTARCVRKVCVAY